MATRIQEAELYLLVLTQCVSVVFAWLVKGIPSVALFLATGAQSSQKGIPLYEITARQLLLTDTAVRAGAF